MRTAFGLAIRLHRFHASRRNDSPGPRWSMITAYNARSNNPFREHHHPRYHPLDRWADAALMRLADVGISDGDGTIFMNHDEDRSAKANAIASATTPAVLDANRSGLR